MVQRSRSWKTRRKTRLRKALDILLLLVKQGNIESSMVFREAHDDFNRRSRWYMTP